jgi:FkbM family methyltransferase
MSLLRTTARRTITKLVAKLPTIARRSIMEALVSGPNCYDLFQAIGRAHGVRDICVLGDYGAIEGSLADDGIMAGYAKHKSWAAETNRLFVGFFATHRAGTYIDIGANLGLTTIPIAAISGVDCKAFEPDPDNYRHLTRNVAEHCRHGNVQLFNLAVYDRTGTIEFEIDVHNHGDHRVHVAGRAGLLMEASRPVIAVQSTRLDDLFDIATLKRPLVVKMDTQGSEGQIFAGGERLLAESTLIFFEYWPYSMRRFSADIDALTKFIERTFPTGSIVPGDQDAPPNWQSIDQVIKTMHERWRLAEAEPFVYHEIYLRKEDGGGHDLPTGL